MQQKTTRQALNNDWL